MKGVDFESENAPSSNPGGSPATDSRASSLPPVTEQRHSGSPTARPREARRSAWSWLLRGALGGASVLVAAAIVARIGLSQRVQLEGELTARKREVQAGSRVLVAKVASARAERQITILGEVQPYRRAMLYANISGYLKEVRVDKGDYVRKGQVLGVLDSPEADQRVVENHAELVVKTQVAERYQKLLKQGVVSEQEMERAKGDLDVTTADGVRVRALRDYAFIRAPFDGVVIARNADQGALLQAATSSTQSATSLGEIADLSRVRVRIYLGAYDAPFVHDGDAATLWTDAEPQKKIEAKVTRLTRALDTKTRTMLVEIDLDNASGALYAGAPIHVILRVAAPSSLTVPAEALLVSKKKPVLAVIRDGRVVFVPVECGDDDGETLRVRGALSLGELVALRAADDLQEGAAVRAVLKPSDSGKGNDKR